MNTNARNQKWISLLLLVSLLLPAAGCGIMPGETGGVQSEQLASKAERVPAQALRESEVDTLTAGNTDFAWRMYHQVEGEYENLFYSPYSISLALAMTYAGARGQTEEEMAETLGFNLTQEAVHQAFNTLDQTLETMDDVELPEDSGKAFQFNIANAIWGQQDYPFEQPFLDTLAKYYGAGLRLLNFMENAEQARQTINQWVEDETNEKIVDTRLVLTNAIYFNASWMEPFAEDLTEEGAFTTLAGEEVQVPMMTHSGPQSFRYGRGENYQVVEIPYVGNQASMVVLVPDRGAFEDVEDTLDAETWGEIQGVLSPASVKLTLPKYEFESEISLAETLAAMGMPSAFGEGADFSGMTGDRSLFISDVFHKAYVGVDEEGTEAAAATAVVMMESAMPAEPLEMRVDRPFLFLIQERETGSVLFLGRVLNPMG